MSQDAEPFFEEIGEGRLYVGGDGQIPKILETCPVAQSNKPQWSKVRADAIHLSKLDEYDLYQWKGRKSDGYFYNFGKLLRLTEAGKRAIDDYDNNSIKGDQ